MSPENPVPASDYWMDERLRRTDHHAIPRGEGIRVYRYEPRGRGSSS